MVSRLALFGLLILGCQSTGADDPVRLDARLQPAFDELKAAVDEGSDEVARAILARLRPRCSDPLSVMVAEGYERILNGRSVRDAVQARVVIEQVEEGFAVELILQQQEFQVLELTPGYVRIEWTAWSMDVLGRQSVQVGGRVIPSPGTWVLEEGGTTEVPLGVDSPKLREGFLAVRCEWHVSLGAGSTVLDEKRFPAQGFQVSDGVLVRLSKELPTGPVEPSEMVRYALGEDVRRAALLERVVRILPARYVETLNLLTERQQEFSPIMMQELVPVLAWLTGTSGINAAGKEWRSWLLERSVLGEGVGNLDLPDRRSR